MHCSLIRGYTTSRLFYCWKYVKQIYIFCRNPPTTLSFLSTDWGKGWSQLALPQSTSRVNLNSIVKIYPNMRVGNSLQYTGSPEETCDPEDNYGWKILPHNSPFNAVQNEIGVQSVIICGNQQISLYCGKNSGRWILPVVHKFQWLIK